MARRFETHRLEGDLTAALRAALAAHQARHGGAPSAVVVNPTLSGKAAQALQALGLAGVDVGSNAGCLAWECWTANGQAQAPAGVVASAAPAAGQASG